MSYILDFLPVLFIPIIMPSNLLLHNTKSQINLSKMFFKFMKKISMFRNIKSSNFKKQHLNFLALKKISMLRNMEIFIKAKKFKCCFLKLRDFMLRNMEIFITTDKNSRFYWKNKFFQNWLNETNGIFMVQITSKSKN